MKSTIALFSLALAFAVPSLARDTAKPQLAQVRKVYLLPMPGGLDQFLANRLTSMGVFQVVTEPKDADAIFTDRIGEVFEERQAELFPKPVAPPKQEPAPPPTPEPAAAAQQAAPGAPAPAEKPPAPPTPPAAETPKQADAPTGLMGDRIVPPATFHRARGTVFLVDPRSRLVIWSMYAPPKSSSAGEMDRTATRIADRLHRDLKSH